MFARIALGVAAMTAAALSLTGLTAATASVHPQTPVISEISTPGVESFNMATRTQVWFTEGASERLGILTP